MHMNEQPTPVRFDVRVEDVIAFNVFHTANSKSRRRLMLLMRLAVPVAAVVTNYWWLAWAANHPSESLPGLIVLALPAVLWYFGLPYFFRLMIAWLIPRSLAEGSNPTMLGEHEMSLDGDRLVVRSKFLESRLDLRAIVRIVQNERYSFVYISSVAAYVIIRNSLTDSFIEELRSAMEKCDVASERDERISNPTARRDVRA